MELPACDVLVTDPPYGRGWRQGRLSAAWEADDSHPGIAGDRDSTIRDAILEGWPGRAIVFGDLMLAPPSGTRQVLLYAKPSNAGIRGATAGFRRDVEAVYLVGPWPSGLGGRSSILTTANRTQGGAASPAGRYDHPHAKPVDLMLELLTLFEGSVVDPFAGSGSTLVAAKALGRRSVGIEIEERYCEVAAVRCAQEVLWSPAAVPVRVASSFRRVMDQSTIWEAG